MLIPHNPSRNLRKSGERPIEGIEDVHITVIPDADPQEDRPAAPVASGRTAAFNRRPPPS